MRKIIATLALSFVVFAGFAQESAGSTANPLSFMAGLNLGTDVIVAADGTKVSWTKLTFQPDLAIGKFGVGVDLSFHFRFYPQEKPDQAIDFLIDGDWVPKSGQNILDLYLPKILYVRYGLKGQDPIFAKLGAIDDLNLGNGFIMSDYSNMSFMPETRFLGLDCGLDAAAFKFPYLGLELLTGNVARLDVIGGRFFARPFLWSTIPVLKDMEIGGTMVMDNKPGAFKATTHTEGTVKVYGADLLLPLIGGKIFPMAVFADMAFEPNESMGAMAGVGGKLLGFINYSAQIRFLQEGFIPSYFDANYDLYRSAKFDYLESTTGGDMYAAWFASLGFGFLENKIVFNARLDGPFKAIPTTISADQTAYPHLKAVVNLAEGVLGGFYFNGSYEKYYLGSDKGFFGDLINPEDAIIGLAINYKTGASVLTLKYNAKYDPTITADNKWVVTSSITAAMKF